MNFPKLAAFLADRREPKFRLAQVKQAFFVEKRASWDDVTVFPKALRMACAEEVPWSSLAVRRVQEGDGGETIKTLFTCADGQSMEAVLMSHEDERNTVCISSQIGCAMACRFCATGTMGLKRNLTSEEMVDQVMHYARMLKQKEAAITNVVLMGMGEPLHNYDQMMQALRTLNDQEGFCLGARHMSVSTCGIVPGILRLADEQFQINLAISLHSAIDEVRSKIMPVNNAYPLRKLMDAVHVYMEKTNRKVMFEYLLLSGINDRPEDALALKRLFGSDMRLVHVNLIKYHDTHAFAGTPRDRRIDFLNELHALGISATHRITFGEDIDAACGQLAVKDEATQILQGKQAIDANRAAQPLRP